MASTYPYTSFTITQPFLGAPLQFQPALGTKELEELIDAFVTGSARKQDKFSEVTLDLYSDPHPVEGFTVLTSQLATTMPPSTSTLVPSPEHTMSFPLHGQAMLSSKAQPNPCHPVSPQSTPHLLALLLPSAILPTAPSA
jgi:hypothetical protein